MSQKHQKSQARSISVNAIAEKPLLIWDYVAFAAIAVFCFLVFQQSDLLHTAGCSYGYLNGHFRDFYDYCGTFDIHPAYMPSFYLIFAIWNIPMRLFGIVTFPTENLPVTPGKIMMNAWNGIGVDSWLKAFDGTVPLTAEYEWARFTAEK